MARVRKITDYDLNSSFVDTSKNLYSVDAAKSLRFWCRMNPGSPTDLGPNSLSPTYDSSPVVASIILGNKTYYALVANDAAGQAAKVSATSGLLSFSSAASGGVPSAGTDRSFSVSLWVKLDNLAAYQLLFSKDAGSGSYTNYEYRVNVNGTGRVEFYLKDINANAEQRVYYSSISAGQWYHLTFTYDGRGGTNAYLGVKIYVNGVEVSTTASTTGTYVGMNPNYNFPLLIAQDADEADELDGQVSEFAVWGVALSNSEVLAIYNVTRNGAFSVSSGIISNPARILLQERDNKTGSYPTIARTGDPDFTGAYSSLYDDTNTVNFVGSSQTVYPTGLRSTSKWVSGGVATPNILQGLTTVGTASKGVADAHISFTPGENLSAFNESRVYIDNDAEFYQTGTDESILPGFGQRLGSKAIVNLSTNPITTTTVVFSTGTNELTKPQTFVLRFVNASKSSYVPAAPANSHAITISVTGSSVSDGIPGSSTTGGNATSTYGFVFNDGLNQGNIADLTTRQKVIIDISTAANQRDIAQAFVTGVNNLTNAPFFAEFTTDAATYVFNNYGDTLASANHPASRNYVVIRNKNPGKPLLGSSATTKVDYTSFSYTNGGPSCDGAEGFLSSVISGTVLCTGVDQTLYANSNQGIAAGINSGISYFNWESKKWELIGNHTRGRNVDYANSEPHIVTSSMLTTIPVAYTNSKIRDYDYSQLGNLTGLPCDTAGFPLSVKFDATGSQVISMTGSLSSPFMVEKISLTFSASMGIGGFTDAASQAHNATFFLMLQREQHLNSTIDGTFENFNLFKSPRQINNGASKQKQQKDRRIVWFGRVGKYNSNQISLENLQVVSSSLYNSCDLWIGNNYSSVTGTFTVNAPCRVVGKTPRATPNLLTREMNLVNSFFGIQDGGRNLENISDGRSFIRGVLGSQLSGSITTIESNEGNDYIKTYANVFADSPFVMLPDDKLILAFVNQPFPNSFGTPKVFNESQLVASHSFDLCPGAGNITLYGSLLRNNLPVSQETNQPLTSEAIHEDLHYDNPVFDQFDVEPYSSLSGSYIDLIVTGSMLATPIGDPTAANVRKVQASVAAGQAGTTGSLQRFVNLASESDVFYDSYPPNVGTILGLLGKGLIDDGAGGAYLVLTTGTNYTDFDAGWYFRSAYEISSRRMTTFKNSNIVANSYDGSGNLVNSNVSPAINQAFLTDELTGILRFAKLSAPGNSYSQSNLNWNNLNEAEKVNLMYKYIFGFGNDGRFANATRFQTGPGVQLLYAFDSIRGYKYGLNGLFGTYTSSRFRRDRYGQFRDMLEQSPNAAYFVNNSVEYPLEVKFFSRPSRDGKGRLLTDPSLTHTQNLNAYATSSLPYFDGDARERGDNPDVTLKPVSLG